MEIYIDVPLLRTTAMYFKSTGGTWAMFGQDTLNEIVFFLIVVVHFDSYVHQNNKAYAHQITLLSLAP